MRSREYRALLVLAALVGLVVSFASWGFLELIHALQLLVFDDLPDALGFDGAPSWWPLPWLVLAGLTTALAIERLPGRGGHVPADGLHTGKAPTQPVELPGILLASIASLSLGVVLGPEAPLIAFGAGLSVLALQVVRRDAPSPVVGVIAAAGSFAAISSLFGSPIVGAVIIIEAAGIGGAVLPVILLPGLTAAAIGSLVFIGMGDWTGLSTSAYALSPLPLQPASSPGAADIVWTLLLALAAAIVVFAIIELAKAIRDLVRRSPVVLTAAAGLCIGLLAVAFDLIADEPSTLVLFSGQEAFAPLFGAPGGALTTGALVLLLVCKGLAWSASLGRFRGGPTFPALFLGAVAGLLAADLPGFSESPAVAVLMAAACTAVLRLPLSSVIIAFALTASAGLAVTPLIVLAAVVAYLTILSLEALLEARSAASTESTAAPPA